MQNSLFFKNVINSDSIFESIGQLSDIAKKTIGCEHISLFLIDEKHQSTPASYSVNISTAVMEQLQQIVLQTQFFFQNPDGIRLSVHKAEGHIKKYLIMSKYECIYGFHIKHGPSYGALMFSFPSDIQLTEDQLHLCNLIKLHMEQLIKKIQFLETSTETESLRESF